MIDDVLEHIVSEGERRMFEEGGAMLTVDRSVAIPEWGMGPFVRAEGENPIISPMDELFECPVVKTPISWKRAHVFNPAAVVHEGKVYVLYRAEDGSGDGIGTHTSRIGLAESADGIHFDCHSEPVFYPSADDDQAENEWPGGCEDPRIVSTEDGVFLLTYTQWNRRVTQLGIATSVNLKDWVKYGPAFGNAYDGRFAHVCHKSGSIVTRLVDDRLVATKINGKYWMYWGDTSIFAAWSDDLIHWNPVLDADGEPLVALAPQPGTFDSGLCEPGPPAVVTDKGILLLYNGMNDPKAGDARLAPGAYSAGQALFDLIDPTALVARSDGWFLTPEEEKEATGQYFNGGTVFIEGLAYFNGCWYLYYGAADSYVAVAYWKP